MNIKILDSWLREYVKTDATVNEIGRLLSLSSVGVERIEKSGSDYIYDIEVTTNRPDLMSVIGIAREAAVVLNQAGIKAEFTHIKPKKIKPTGKKAEIEIKNDPKLVNRILAIVLEVDLKNSPEKIQKRLESTDIRSLNNLVDVTNYVMRETGHPAHVFDYDRLSTKKLIIRESKKGEQIVTLDEKLYTLPGGDIVADNGNGEIVDLLGIMGTANSVVSETTTRILFFLDNLDPHKVRKTSMTLGIRTEAAQLNEKGVDPELMRDAFYRGVELFQEIANAKIISDPIDIYPNKPETVEVSVSTNTVRKIIGVDISDQEIKNILSHLEFQINGSNGMLNVTVPSWRAGDVAIEEDIIEEVARIYGYHTLPSILPPQTNTIPYHLDTDQFYWEHRVKEALKYWGFTETYTYSMVSETQYEGDVTTAVTIKNPLDEEHVYMRRTLIPSLLDVVRENSAFEEVKLFEIANVYLPRPNDLPEEQLHLAGVIKRENISFFEVKGYLEQLATDLGIKNLNVKASHESENYTEIVVGREAIGTIEILEPNLINFELNFATLIAHATRAKTYSPIPKHPPIIEDLRLQMPAGATYQNIVQTIKNQSSLVKKVELIDTYGDKKTFRIFYQHQNRNLTNEEITDIRKKIINALKQTHKAVIV